MTAQNLENRIGTMKFSYSQKLGKYVVTELGKLIDSDEDGIALGIRHGLISDQSDDDDTDYSQQLAPASDDDDDRALINDLLFNDDHDTPTNY